MNFVRKDRGTNQRNTYNPAGAHNGKPSAAAPGSDKHTSDGKFEQIDMSQTAQYNDEHETHE